MSALRWWAQKIGKENVIARTNTAYAIADRVFVTNVSKARDRDPRQLSRIQDLRIRISLRLQALFGLRREESIKIIPAWADRGDSLVLKDSWTKGGRPREIPIRTREQRQLLEEAKAIAEGKSLVAPGYTTYRAYLRHFHNQCARAGIYAFHGHRHGYAQTRYQELTGWPCPARGGPGSRDFSPEKGRSTSRPDSRSATSWATTANQSPPCTWVVNALPRTRARRLAPGSGNNCAFRDAARRAKDDVGSRPLIALASDYGNYVHRPIGGAWCVGQHEGSNFRWRWSCAD